MIPKVLTKDHDVRQAAQIQTKEGPILYALNQSRTLKLRVYDPTTHTMVAPPLMEADHEIEGHCAEPHFCVLVGGVIRLYFTTFEKLGVWPLAYIDTPYHA